MHMTYPTKWEVSTETKETCQKRLQQMLDEVVKVGQGLWCVTSSTIEQNDKGGYYCCVAIDRRGV